MRVFKIHRSDGYLLAFEIEIAYFRLKNIRNLLNNLGEVTDVRSQKDSNDSNEIKLSFKYCGIEFVVWEPFGDNSRYWIGPRNEKNSSDIDILTLANAFLEYRPSILMKLVGDLVTLNFKSLFNS